jgi:hypothetical protein
LNGWELLAAHAVCTWFMVGLIWFVQIVHYPLMAGVGADGFVVYSREHQRRTTWVVAAPMLLEGLTAGLLSAAHPTWLDSPAWLLGLALLALIWFSTALWQVPIHGQLEKGYNADLVRRLVRSNWLRTIAWSVRGALVAQLLAASWTGATA